MTTRALIPLCCALLLGAAPLFAQSTQTAQPQPKAPANAPAKGADGQASASQPATPTPETPQKSGGKDSPFDYSASERISEDLPVSFPVDI